MSWGVYELADSPDEVHVAPADERHDFGCECECCPRIDVGVKTDGNPYFLVVHKALDQ